MSRVERRVEVPAELDGQRLDLGAARLLVEFSRSRLKEWILSGELQLNGRPAQPRRKLATGDVLSLLATLEPSEAWLAQDIDLDVVYEDAALLVVNKPAGLVVHPAAGHRDGTLLNALLYRCPALAELPRAGIVHRLDRDTTGLMVVAKTLASHTSLVAQLQARSVKRHYQAVAVGVLRVGGSVAAPMGRHPVQRKKMAVLASGGKEAVTHYSVLQRFAAHTHLCLQLETGRTHQIRVHMNHLGYPLVGDPLYGGRQRPPPASTPELRDQLAGFQRQALHAWRLALAHPVSGAALHWEAQAPADFRALLAALEAGS